MSTQVREEERPVGKNKVIVLIDLFITSDLYLNWVQLSFYIASYFEKILNFDENPWLQVEK